MGMYDVIVIGGGPAGLMAAASAGMHGARVLLLDKGDKLGRKLAISGGGRCNVTNNKDIDELIRNIPGNGRFLYSVFAEFDNRDLARFFEDMGVRLKEEDNGRMFPVSDSAKSVVNALVRNVRAAGTEIRTHTPVERVIYENGRVWGVQVRGGEKIRARAVVVATGGKSVPHTGSTGDGYVWAEEAGHTITELFPTEVPLTSKEPFIRNRSLQGLSLRDVTLTVLHPVKSKKLVTHRGDALFTHFGLSGPAALRCSQFVVKALRQTGAPDVPVVIDFFPDESANALEEKWWSHARNHPKRTLRNTLKELLPDRLVETVLGKAGVDGDTTGSRLSREGLRSIVKEVKQFTVRISGTLPLEKAFVTGGGVHVKEIDPRTMQSKRMPGLFFCGEVIDVHGYTGGYNITAASCTGYVAGKHAALLSKAP
ncbi:NAD(P)/FAD-dependent oxidoreductase [Staphylospora marina]|uniref:NAD(P)/FAD-dependent oxidoreductase n=1 Tax=Staphylospora marina TaxID=2490858 RepID=UPI000F5BABF7|nr:NAD(P)/FAD-dependent oxidoreductase [Staphylospora marina]